MIRFFTSRYSNQSGILDSGAVPVAITVGMPRFKLQYVPADGRFLAPWGLLTADDWQPRYRARLDSLGADVIRQRLQQLVDQHDGRPLTLLCFERDPSDCHRSTLADWLVEHGVGNYLRELL